MQKTETYKLNLIELDDTFSPQPLNENAQKLEDALSGAVGGLDQRLAAIEAHKLAIGSYTGSSPAGGSTTQTIQLGFDPAMVYAQCCKDFTIQSALALPGSPFHGMQTDTLTIVPGGFAVQGSYNSMGAVYNYFAFA